MEVGEYTFKMATFGRAFLAIRSRQDSGKIFLHFAGSACLCFICQVDISLAEFPLSIAASCKKANVIHLSFRYSRKQSILFCNLHKKLYL